MQVLDQLAFVCGEIVLGGEGARMDRLCGDTCPYVCPQTGLN